MIVKYATWSLHGACVGGAVLFTWAATFLIGGKKVVGEKTWNELSVTNQIVEVE